MAKYYTKEILKTKVKMLGDAIGSPFKVISCNGEYAIQYASGHGSEPFGWAGWYHPLKQLIIYLDGALAGIKAVK